MQTFVIYDIGNDRLRSRIERACRDHGLSRIQYSVFQGELDPKRTERMTEIMQRIIDEYHAAENEDDQEQELGVLILPVGAGDFAKAKTLTRQGAAGTEPILRPAVLVL